MPPISRRSFVSGVAGVAAGASLTANGPSLALAQATPPSSPTSDAGWSFIDDRDRTVELPAVPVRIHADVMAGLSLWTYGIKPVVVSGWMSIYTLPPEWDDVVKIDLEAGEMDIEQLIQAAPDISIGLTWDMASKNDFGAVDEGTMPGFLDVAPSLCIKAVEASIDASINRFRDLAAALGAEVSSSDLDTSAEEYRAASEAVRSAVAAKPGLTAMAIAGTPDAVWIGNPASGSDLIYFSELGLAIVEPASPGSYASELFQQISWEQLGEYAADLYIYDNRAGALPVEDMLEMPVVQLLPAFQAGQYVPWPVEYIVSHAGLTPTLTALADAVNSAEVVTS